MKKTTFYTSVGTLIIMGTLLFFVGIENYQDEMLPKGVRESSYHLRILSFPLYWVELGLSLGHRTSYVIRHDDQLILLLLIDCLTLLLGLVIQIY